MALNVPTSKAETLATDLAKQKEETKPESTEELEDIANRCAGLPVVDVRSADEILGYDEHGLPG